MAQLQLPHTYGTLDVNLSWMLGSSNDGLSFRRAGHRKVDAVSESLSGKADEIVTEPVTFNSFIDDTHPINTISLGQAFYNRYLGTPIRLQ